MLLYKWKLTSFGMKDTVNFIQESYREGMVCDMQQRKATGNETVISSRQTYWKGLWQDIKRDRYLYLLLLPVVILVILFYYVPLGGVVIAFKQYNVYTGIWESPWIGLDNFIKFFTGPYFQRTLVNTLLISFYSILFGFPIPILFALMINETKSNLIKKSVQTCSYMPHFVSTVVIVGMVIDFLSPSTGIINKIIELFGGESIYFMMEPRYFRTIFTITNIWTGAGFASIIYISALSSVSQELYEAASIDGCGRFKKIWYVTLPGILPTIVIMFILRLGQILNVSYEMIILMYRPATYSTADVISSYVYRQAFEQGSDYALSTAVDLVNSVVSLVIVFVSNRISKATTEIGIW